MADYKVGQKVLFKYRYLGDRKITILEGVLRGASRNKLDYIIDTGVERLEVSPSNIIKKLFKKDWYETT